MTQVCTVLRSGGDYTLEHVYAIKRMLNRHLPEHTFMCLTDTPGSPWFWFRPLEHGYPGWWAKLELCRPDIEGPLLYLDLDTVVVGDITRLCGHEQSWAMRDVYRGRRNPYALQSCLMWLTEADRARVWGAWWTRPDEWMRMPGGDQMVYECALSRRVGYWQDREWGVYGYKTDLDDPETLPDDAAVICFHGQPRPWDTTHEWVRDAWAL